VKRERSLVGVGSLPVRCVALREEKQKKQKNWTSLCEWYYDLYRTETGEGRHWLNRHVPVRLEALAKEQKTISGLAYLFGKTQRGDNLPRRATRLRLNAFKIPKLGIYVNGPWTFLVCLFWTSSWWLIHTPNSILLTGI